MGYNLDGCPNSIVLPGELETCKASLEAHVYNGSDLETADTGLRTFTRTFSSTLLVMVTTAIFKIDNIKQYLKKDIHLYKKTTNHHMVTKKVCNLETLSNSLTEINRQSHIDQN